MRRFILHTIYFSVGMFAIAAVINYRLSHTITDHYELQYREVKEPERHAQAIILGGSHATHGVRPAILDSLGVTFYNFALNGANPKFYVRWYRNIFSPQYEKPTVCVLAVEWFFFDDAWLWRRYEQDSEYFPLGTFVRNLLDRRYDAKTLLFNRFPFLKYRSIRRVLGGVKVPYDMAGYDGGYVPFVPPTRDLGENAFAYTTNPVQQARFEEFVEALIDDGIQVILVNLPEYGHTRVEYERVATYRVYEDIAGRYQIPFLNYNIERRSALNDDPAYYADWGHLNARGSVAFTRMLREDLREYIDR